MLDLYVEESKTEAYEQAQALRIHALAAQGDGKSIKKHADALDRYSSR